MCLSCVLLLEMLLAGYGTVTVSRNEREMSVCSSARRGGEGGGKGKKKREGGKKEGEEREKNKRENKPKRQGDRH